MQRQRDINRLKKRIRKNPAVLNTLRHEKIPLEEFVFDIARGLAGSFPDGLEGINAALGYLLSRMYEDAANIPLVAGALSRAGADSLFREWLREKSLYRTGESLAVRCLSFVRFFPDFCDGQYLCDEFMLLLNRADLCLNPRDIAAEHIFSALIETIIDYVRCPEDDNEFDETFGLIEKEVRRKIEELEYKKLAAPKEAEFMRMFFENDLDDTAEWNEFFVEFVLRQTELRRFLFSGLGIPVSYLIFFIALDERGHFSPLVRQSAMSALCNAPEKCLWEKLRDRRSDFFTLHPAAAPVAPDVTVQEFAHSVAKALRLSGAGYDYGVITEIARAVLETLPESRAFLHDYPLAISDAPGADLLSVYWYTLSLKTISQSPGGPASGRSVLLKDFTPPNSRGIPAALFRDKDLAVPFIHREYLRSLGVENEAELRLRMAKTAPKIFVPEFVRAQTVTKAKRLIETYMTFLDMYAQGDDQFESQGGQTLTRDDIALLLENKFDLSALTAESLLHAKIMLWYVEPIRSIFDIGEADQEALSRINEYIESVYGKPLSAEQAREKARAVINSENENVAAVNRQLESEADMPYPLLQEDSPQWVRLFNILVRKYTRRNTLTLWELRGVLYDMREKPRAPFFYPAFAAAGGRIRRAILRAVTAIEKDYPAFKKVREKLYDYFFNRLDKAEKALDVCGRREQGGECLRRDRQCCTIPFSCPDLTAAACSLKALSCKFWLCSAARARLAATRRGRSFLAKRRRYSFWCRALNIPLKIRCSRRDSFDDKAPRPFADVSERDWFDRPLKE